MATIDKEQRARRKLMKNIHELNQLVKNIYTSYVIFDNGMIIGKAPKDKYEHGYFKSESILDTNPELSNTCLFANSVFVSFRDDKPEKLTIEEGKIYLHGEKDKYYIGILMNGEMLSEAHKRASIITDEVSFVMSNIDNKMVFSDEMIDQLVGYEKIIPRFYDKDEYPMHLTISEFPFLKKFKNCIVYMRDTDPRFFDVVYSTFNDIDKFIMRRRFIKVITEDKGKGAE